jgi:DNA repair protein RadC
MQKCVTLKEIMELRNFNRKTNLSENNGNNINSRNNRNNVNNAQTDNQSKDNETPAIAMPELTTKPKKKPTKKQAKGIHGGHRQRLKFQFLESGIDSLSDIQKLELLLYYAIPQKDTNPLAHKLLEEFRTIGNILSADVSELTKIKGVKENTALLIKLVGSFVNLTSRPSLEDVISSTSKAKEFCTKLFVGVEVEQFYVLCLSKSNKVKKAKLVQTGTLDEVNVQIRNITAFAIENKCSRIIVSHNHPSGFGVMSDEDCAFTYSLICSCLLNSIDVLDHIIVGTDKTISLCEQRIMSKLRERAVKTIQLPKEKDMYLSSWGEEYIICKE